MNRKIAMALFLVGLSVPAFAKSPADIADLVGARAAGAESEIQARGYDNVKNNIWWNAATGTCVRVRVSNGRYSAIDTLQPSACGKKSGSAASGSCPPDVSEADRYKYPACQGSGSGNAAAASGNVPQAALSACMRRADDFQNARQGTSVVNGAARSGANWVLTMATGQYTSKCTVSGSGRVVSMDPM
ncbi:hypothetical protein JNB88_32915 [Rhizobium cauense]|uniref:hypothetical protein n=1 Tax=Rhizobium cauense TaxID=1166683 RepID=UPI001C6E9E9C|nr:hypothetical protein [Rhizobium cauense]MBW9118401.1 hypothetical protein [Rhizobium cauense]